MIHAGFHKTGTTSVQAALAAHAPELRPHVLALVLRGADPLLRMAAQEARRLSLQPAGPARARLETCLQLWAEALVLAPGQGLILSAEDFAGHMPGHPGIASYASAPCIAATLASVLRARFPGADLRFVYGTRAPGPWLRSLHWQQAKRHDMTESAADFAARLADAVHPAPILAEIAPHAPVTAAALEDHAPRRLGPVEALYDAAGLPDALRASLAPLPAANAASADLAAAFVALNRTAMDPAARDAAKAALLAKARQTPFAPPPAIA